jgi:hypothetical protein
MIDVDDNAWVGGTMRNAIGLGFMICFLFAQRATAQDVAATVAASAPRTGGLTMDVQGGAELSAKQVGISVQPGGQAAVSGVADVIGFPFIQNGPWADVDWKVDGSQISGVLKRKDGKVEGTFEGTITATGVSGKFTHSDGRVGLWSWDGPPPHATSQ